MSSKESVTTWVEQLRRQPRRRAAPLGVLFPASRRPGSPEPTGAARRAADEEDVALSAFDSFCRGVEQGRFPLLNDRDDLWALLVVITVRKAIDLRQHERRQKRGGGQVAGESALDLLLGSDDGGAGINQLVGAEPTPELAAQLAEEFELLLSQSGQRRTAGGGTVEAGGAYERGDRRAPGLRRSDRGAAAEAHSLPNERGGRLRRFVVWCPAKYFDG